MSKANPLILTEDEFLNLNGATFLKGAEPALHRIPGGLPKRTKRFYLDKVQSDMKTNSQRREELRLEYRRRVKAGEIQPPTRIQLWLEQAHSFEEHEATHAARRMLAKRGIDWTQHQPPKRRMK